MVGADASPIFTGAGMTTVSALITYYSILRLSVASASGHHF
jgi:hypothetical protein